MVLQERPPEQMVHHHVWRKLGLRYSLVYENEPYPGCGSVPVFCPIASGWTIQFLQPTNKDTLSELPQRFSCNQWLVYYIFLLCIFFFFFFYEPVLFLSCLLGRSCALCSILAQDNTEREKQSEKLDELF